jgi:hypothetical protein
VRAQVEVVRAHVTRARQGRPRVPASLIAGAAALALAATACGGSVEVPPPVAEAGSRDAVADTDDPDPWAGFTDASTEDAAGKPDGKPDGMVGGGGICPPPPPGLC